MEDFFKLFTMAIPILAIVGGISVAIVRILTQARLEELARRERIAMIERGADPSKLPPLAGGGEDMYGFGDSRLRRAHGLVIGGFILLAVGIALGFLLTSIEPDKGYWVIGLGPLLVGFALLGSAAVVWPRKK
jgi:hypothetical protein